MQQIKSNLIGLNSKLLIVTKNQNSDDIKFLINDGYYLLGKTRSKKLKKFQFFVSDSIELHLIGPLQTNKVKDALKIFDTIQTVDRYKLVEEINKELEKSKPYRTKEFFIQINIGDEIQKSGISKKNVKDFFDYCIFKGLNIKGLMCIPPSNEDADVFFKEMRNIRDSIDSNLLLSMGMSNDYQIALKYEADIIRVGSKIFEKKT